MRLSAQKTDAFMGVWTVAQGWSASQEALARNEGREKTMHSNRE
jgi:hypothetical protein